MLKFGDKIKALRKQKGITQAQLKNELHVSLSTIGMYETNKIQPSPDMLNAIAKYFEISLDELFEDCIVEKFYEEPKI
jgi:transcriptional regulator, XRE